MSSHPSSDTLQEQWLRPAPQPSSSDPINHPPYSSPDSTAIWQDLGSDFLFQPSTYLHEPLIPYDLASIYNEPLLDASIPHTEQCVPRVPLHSTDLSFHNDPDITNNISSTDSAQARALAYDDFHEVPISGMSL